MEVITEWLCDDDVADSIMQFSTQHTDNELWEHPTHSSVLYSMLASIPGFPHPDDTNKRVLACLLWADELRVTLFRGVKMYPVFMSLLNYSLEVRRSHKGAKLVAFIPVNSAYTCKVKNYKSTFKCIGMQGFLHAFANEFSRNSSGFQIPGKNYRFTPVLLALTGDIPNNKQYSSSKDCSTMKTPMPCAFVLYTLLVLY